MRIKDKNKIKILFFIVSLYYFPYLIFDWIGVAGGKAETVPFWYKIFMIILSIFILWIFNIKFSKKSFKKNILAIILLFFNILSNLFFSNQRIGISIFFLNLVFLNGIVLNTKVLKKTLIYTLFFSLFSVFFEKYCLLNIFGINPPFVMSWQERYVGNMGGPNVLGAFINYIYAFLIFCENNKIKKIIYFITSFYIVIKTDSDSGILIFILTNVYLFFYNFKYLFSKLIYIMSGLIILIILLVKKHEIFIKDGSNLVRINMTLEQIKNIKLFHLKIIFNESPYLMILFSYGMIAFVIYILLLRKIYITNVKNYRNNKKFYYLKKIIYFQMIIYSLVLPIKFMFPLNILYVFALKLKNNKRIEVIYDKEKMGKIFKKNFYKFG